MSNPRPSWTASRQLWADLGDLLASQDRATAARDFTRYRDDPIGFARDVLGINPWPKQAEIGEAVRDHPQVTVRSCHAAGKDWAAGRWISLWWVYARRGLVILTGPSAAQVEEILMRKEVAAGFRAGGLPGELHIRALRPGESASHAGILARTGASVHGMTGFHEALVLYIISEAQDPDIEHAWDAAFACATGADDRILTLGNPTEPDGRFYRAHQPGSGWHSIRIAASDIPNVQAGETIIPGLLTREGVERFRREYGQDSAVFRSRVEGEFPAEATDALITRAWWDRSVDLHRNGSLERDAGRRHHTLGVDPARLGPDRSVVCIRRGPVVQGFEEWRGLDTMMTADRVQGIVRRLLESYRAEAVGGAVEAVYCDEIGLGGGVLDRLRETLPRLEWSEYVVNQVWPNVRSRTPSAYGFMASKNAGYPERFVNLRAQGYWTLRKLLEDGRIAIPDVEPLREELLATRVRFAPDGRVAIEAKETLAARLGRSPDYADALVISLTPMIEYATRKIARMLG